MKNILLDISFANTVLGGCGGFYVERSSKYCEFAFYYSRSSSP